MAACSRIEEWMTNVSENSYFKFFMSLLTAIVSFADPLTDILTLVEFYREDHKTWFAVGLTFVVLPCVSFLILMPGRGSRIEVCLCGFNPFSASWVRLKIWWTNFRKCCCDDNSNEYDEVINEHSNWALLVEAGLESAPQFIIQLYAMTVQQEPVKIIQMISVPVSFLSLARAFTAYDPKDIGLPVGPNALQKCFLFGIYILVLSSRLFAIAFFAITYKWWIISVLIIHAVLILIVDTIWSCRIRRDFKDWSHWVNFCQSALFFLLHWLRDDMSPTIYLPNEYGKKAIKQRMHLVSNVLFVVENCIMILIFYRFSPFSNTWYSLPLTVCVCSFSVIGAVARVAHVCCVTKESNRVQDNPDVNTEPKLVMNKAGKSTKGVSRFDMI